MKTIVRILFSTTILAMLVSTLAISQPPLATGKPKFVGNIYSFGPTITEFTKYWNQVTPENSGKWGSVEGGQDGYNWTPLDDAYNFAQQNGFLYKHHTLIWGSQQPSWMTDGSLDSANQRAEIEEWMQLSGARYPNAHFVDVVNEPLPGHAPPAYKNALGGDGETGWDWVITAFELARQYWPSAQLHLNDYNIINSSSNTSQYLVIIKLLKERGLIDGIGVQGHSFEVYSTSVATLKANLDSLAATGLPIYISEFDINEPNDSIQVVKYQTIFPTLYEHPGVKGITLWGYIEGGIWQEDAYLLENNGGWVERPALVWLRNYLAAPLRPVSLSPDGTTDAPRNPILTWSPSVSATSYRVQVNTNRLFSDTAMVLDTTVVDIAFRSPLLSANTTYYWRVNASNSEGTSYYSTTATFTTGEVIVSVEDREPEIPNSFTLSQNFPNPFNPSTTIEFSLPAKSHVRLTLFNVLGQVVKELAVGEFSPGSHRVDVDASDLPSGIYIYRLQAGTSFMQTKKMLLLK